MFLQAMVFHLTCHLRTLELEVPGIASCQAPAVARMYASRPMKLPCIERNRHWSVQAAQ